MNLDKTEFLLVGSSRMVCKCESDTITVTGDTIQRSRCIKYLGTWIDENLSFKEDIKRKCGIAMGNIQRLKRIKHFFHSRSLCSSYYGCSDFTH